MICSLLSYPDKEKYIKKKKKLKKRFRARWRHLQIRMRWQTIWQVYTRFARNLCMWRHAAYKPHGVTVDRHVIVPCDTECYMSHVKSSFLFDSDVMQMPSSTKKKNNRPYICSNLTPAVLTASSWAAATTPAQLPWQSNTNSFRTEIWSKCGWRERIKNSACKHAGKIGSGSPIRIKMPF